MNLNTRKERLSLAYINAVAARSGVVVSEPPVDQSSIDGTLMADFGRSTQINFQAKASARDVMQGGDIRFPLRLKNYDDLRRTGTVPQILIVVLLPSDDVEDWLHQSEDELCLRRCGYWLSLEGRERVDSTSTITVHIPRRNVFDSVQLAGLMDRAARDERCERRDQGPRSAVVVDDLGRPRLSGIAGMDAARRPARPGRRLR